MLQTTKEQIECYLAFIRSHPELGLHKNDPTRPRRIEELWVEFAEQLNALKGPRRTSAKWKESLTHWKNKVRSRSRKAKADRLVTGGGPCVSIEVSEMGQQALDALGSVVVEWVPEVPTIGVENDIIITYDPSSSLVVSTDVSNDTPSTSRTRKSTSEKMFAEMLQTIKTRNDNESQYREESFRCMAGFSESINNMANAILALSQAIVNKK